MAIVRVSNRTTGREVATQVRVADSWWTRFRGLLGQPEPAAEEGLLLRPCRAIHMVGMRYPLDIAFLDARGRVVGIFAEVAPGFRVCRQPGAEAALELRAGRLAASATGLGDELQVVSSGDQGKGSS